MSLRRLGPLTASLVVVLSVLSPQAQAKRDCYVRPGWTFEKAVRDEFIGRDRFGALLHEDSGVLLHIKDLTPADRHRVRTALCPDVRDQVAFENVQFSNKDLLGYVDEIDRFARVYPAIAGWGPEPDLNAIKVVLNRRDPNAALAIRRAIPADALVLKFDPNFVPCLLGNGCAEEPTLPRWLPWLATFALVAVTGLMITFLSRQSAVLGT